MSRMSDIKQVFTDKLRTSGAYRRVFESEDGKIILRHLARAGFLNRSTFVAGDPHQTSLNEGSRRLVLSMMRIAKIDPQKLVNEMEEQL